MISGWDKISRLEHDKQVYKLRSRLHILRTLFWECTLKCNLSCRHCGSDCKLDVDSMEMPLKDFILVLDEIRKEMDSHQMLVITTGGEPLLRKDILQCGQAITARGFYWGMVSNGLLLTSRMLDELIATGLKSITISIDGFEEEHNWLRGHDNSFSGAVSAIKLLNNNSKRITWDVITCVNQKNLNTLPEFRDYLIELGVRTWRIFTVFPIGRASTNEDLQLNSEQFKYLMEFISASRKKGEMHVNYGCEGFLGPYEYEVRDSMYFCHAGINTASILHDGSISGCLSIRSDYTQGNIYQDSFVDVWNRRFDIYRHREWMKTGDCKNCQAWRWCEGNGMHLRDREGKLLLCNFQKMYKTQLDSIKYNRNKCYVI